MSMANPSLNKIFIFKFEGFSSNISEKLLSFYEGNEFFDTILIAGSECFVVEVHKIVLSASSEYFLELFRANSTSTNVHKIELKYTDVVTFKSVINFMYSGWIELSLENIEIILRSAKWLKMQSLIDGCIDFMQKHISVRNCLNWLRLAKEFNSSGLKEQSLNCAHANFEKVSKEEEMLLLDEIELKELLFNKNPYGDFDEDVFLALVHWIEYDKPNRGQLLLQLLSLVRYQFLTPKFIKENRKSVCKTVESYELLCSWLEWHLSPGTRLAGLNNCVLKPKKADGKLTAISCLNSQGIINVQTYNEEIKSWTTAKQLPLWKNKKRSALIVIEEKLIVVGGQKNNLDLDSVECINLMSFRGTTLPSMRHSRCESQLAYLNGNLCVFGGFKKNEFLPALEIFNFTTHEWKDLQPPSEIHQFSQIADCNGILYIADLQNGCLQYYDISSNQWTLKKLKNTERPVNFGFVAVEGFLYVIGGFRSGNTNTVKRYDLANDSWSQIAPLPFSSYSMKTAVIGKKIVICSGYNNGNVVQEYDLDTNQWNTLNSKLVDFPKCRSIVCIVLSDLF